MHTTEEETLVLFRKVVKQATPLVVNVEDVEGFSWLRSLQENLANGASVVVYSHNKPTNGVLGLANCLRRETAGKKLTCFFITDEAATLKFDVNVPFYQKQLKKGLAINVFKNGKWGTYRHLLLEREILVNRQHSYVNATLRGDISSLRWIEGDLTKESVMEPEETLVQVSENFLLSTYKIGDVEFCRFIIPHLISVIL